MAVVSSLRCPSSTWMTRMSVLRSRRWVAKLCRRVCIETRLSSLAASAAAWQARWWLRGGSGRLLPGEEPAAGPLPPPPLPQQVEQVGRQHDEAVLAALALLDPD